MLAHFSVSNVTIHSKCGVKLSNVSAVQSSYASGVNINTLPVLSARTPGRVGRGLVMCSSQVIGLWLCCKYTLDMLYFYHKIHDFTS